MPIWAPVKLMAGWPWAWMAMAIRAMEICSPVDRSMSISRAGGWSGPRGRRWGGRGGMIGRRRLRSLVRHVHEDGLKLMLEHPGNVRDLLQVLQVKLLPRIDFSKMHVVHGRSLTCSTCSKSR